MFSNILAIACNGTSWYGGNRILDKLQTCKEKIIQFYCILIIFFCYISFGVEMSDIFFARLFIVDLKKKLCFWNHKNAFVAPGKQYYIRYVIYSKHVE